MTMGVVTIKLGQEIWSFKESRLKIEEQLQQQLDFLRLPSTKWVQGTPTHPGEGCIVLRNSRSRDSQIREGLSLDTRKWLYFFVKARIAIPFGSVEQWNDKIATGKAEVVQMLEKAIAAAGEQGV